MRCLPGELRGQRLHPNAKEKAIDCGQSQAHRREIVDMKSFAWVVGGFCAAAVGFLVWGAGRTRNLATSLPAAPVDQLAHRLEEAWADHHTVV